MINIKIPLCRANTINSKKYKHRIGLHERFALISIERNGIYLQYSNFKKTYGKWIINFN
jgi:hypothetical protein